MRWLSSRERKCSTAQLGTTASLSGMETNMDWSPAALRSQLRAPWTRFGIMKKSLTHPPGNVSEHFCAMKGWFTRHARFWIIQSGIMLSRGMIFFQTIRWVMQVCGARLWWSPACQANFWGWVPTTWPTSVFSTCGVCLLFLSTFYFMAPVFGIYSSVSCT